MNDFYKIKTTIKHISKLLGILFVFFILNIDVEAQDKGDKEVTTQIWGDYNVSYNVSERFAVYGNMGARTVFPNEWSRYLVTPSVKYKLRKLLFKKLYYSEELHAGLGFFFTDNKSSVNRLEIRVFQGYRLTWPDRPRIKVRHYVRLEERFDLETSDWINTFGLRLRYLAEMRFLLKGDFIKFAKGAYIPISLELFWNLIGVKQFNDAARIIPGLGYEINKAWKAELQFGYHYTRNSVEDNFATNDFVFRIRVFHKILSK